MRTGMTPSTVVLLFSALLIGACGRDDPAQTVGGCGTDLPPGFEHVTEETTDPLFLEASPQNIRFAADVVTAPVYDEEGNQIALRMAGGGGSGDPALLMCACPAGCRPVGTCSWGTNDDGTIAVCGGDCQTDRQSCFGCSFSRTTSSLSSVLAPLVSE